MTGANARAAVSVGIAILLAGLLVWAVTERAPVYAQSGGSSGETCKSKYDSCIKAKTPQSQCEQLWRGCMMGKCDVDSGNACNKDAECQLHCTENAYSTGGRGACCSPLVGPTQTNSCPQKIDGQCRPNDTKPGDQTKEEQKKPDPSTMEGFLPKEEELPQGEQGNTQPTPNTDSGLTPEDVIPDEAARQDTPPMEQPQPENKSWWDSFKDFVTGEPATGDDPSTMHGLAPDTGSPGLPSSLSPNDVGGITNPIAGPGDPDIDSGGPGFIPRDSTFAPASPTIGGEAQPGFFERAGNAIAGAWDSVKTTAASVGESIASVFSPAAEPAGDQFSGSAFVSPAPLDGSGVPITGGSNSVVPANLPDFNDPGVQGLLGYAGTGFDTMSQINNQVGLTMQELGMPDNSTYARVLRGGLIAYENTLNKLSALEAQQDLNFDVANPSLYADIAQTYGQLTHLENNLRALQTNSPAAQGVVDAVVSRAAVNNLFGFGPLLEPIFTGDTTNLRAFISGDSSFANSVTAVAAGQVMTQSIADANAWTVGGGLVQAALPILGPARTVMGYPFGSAFSGVGAAVRTGFDAIGDTALGPTLARVGTEGAGFAGDLSGLSAARPTIGTPGIAGALPDTVPVQGTFRPTQSQINAINGYEQATAALRANPSPALSPARYQSELAVKSALNDLYGTGLRPAGGGRYTPTAAGISDAVSTPAAPSAAIPRPVLTAPPRVTSAYTDRFGNVSQFDSQSGIITSSRPAVSPSGPVAGVLDNAPTGAVIPDAAPLRPTPITQAPATTPPSGWIQGLRELAQGTAIGRGIQVTGVVGQLVLAEPRIAAYASNFASNVADTVSTVGRGASSVLRSVDSPVTQRVASVIDNAVAPQAPIVRIPATVDAQPFSPTQGTSPFTAGGQIVDTGAGLGAVRQLTPQQIAALPDTLPSNSVSMPVADAATPPVTDTFTGVDAARVSPFEALSNPTSPQFTNGPTYEFLQTAPSLPAEAAVRAAANVPAWVPDPFKTLVAALDTPIELARTGLAALNPITPAEAGYCPGCYSPDRMTEVGREADQIFFGKGFTEADKANVFNNPEALNQYMRSLYQAADRNGMIVKNAFPDEETFISYMMGVSTNELAGRFVAPNQICSHAGACGPFQVNYRAGTHADLGVPNARTNAGDHVKAAAWGAAVQNPRIATQRLGTSASPDEIRALAATLYNTGQNNPRTTPNKYGRIVAQNTNEYYNLLTQNSAVTKNAVIRVNRHHLRGGQGATNLQRVAEAARQTRATNATPPTSAVASVQPEAAATPALPTRKPADAIRQTLADAAGAVKTVSEQGKRLVSEVSNALDNLTGGAISRVSSAGTTPSRLSPVPQGEAVAARVNAAARQAGINPALVTKDAGGRVFVSDTNGVVYTIRPVLTVAQTGAPAASASPSLPSLSDIARVFTGQGLIADQSAVRIATRLPTRGIPGEYSAARPLRTEAEMKQTAATLKTIVPDSSGNIIQPIAVQNAAGETIIITPKATADVNAALRQAGMHELQPVYTNKTWGERYGGMVSGSTRKVADRLLALKPKIESGELAGVALNNAYQKIGLPKNFNALDPHIVRAKILMERMLGSELYTIAATETGHATHKDGLHFDAYYGPIDQTLPKKVAVQNSSEGLTGKAAATAAWVRAWQETNADSPGRPCVGLYAHSGMHFGTCSGSRGWNFGTPQTGDVRNTHTAYRSGIRERNAQGRMVTVRKDTFTWDEIVAYRNNSAFAQTEKGTPQVMYEFANADGSVGRPFTLALAPEEVLGTAPARATGADTPVVASSPAGAAEPGSAETLAGISYDIPESGHKTPTQLVTDAARSLTAGGVRGAESAPTVSAASIGGEILQSIRERVTDGASRVVAAGREIVAPTPQVSPTRVADAADFDSDRTARDSATDPFGDAVARPNIVAQPTVPPDNDSFRTGRDSANDPFADTIARNTTPAPAIEIPVMRSADLDSALRRIPAVPDDLPSIHPYPLTPERIAQIPGDPIAVNPLPPQPVISFRPADLNDPLRRIPAFEWTPESIAQIPVEGLPSATQMPPSWMHTIPDLPTRKPAQALRDAVAGANQATPPAVPASDPMIGVRNELNASLAQLKRREAVVMNDLQAIRTSFVRTNDTDALEAGLNAARPRYDAYVRARTALAKEMGDLLKNPAGKSVHADARSLLETLNSRGQQLERMLNKPAFVAAYFSKGIAAHLADIQTVANTLKRASTQIDSSVIARLPVAETPRVATAAMPQAPSTPVRPVAETAPSVPWVSADFDSALRRTLADPDGLSFIDPYPWTSGKIEQIVAQTPKITNPPGPVPERIVRSDIDGVPVTQTLPARTASVPDFDNDRTGPFDVATTPDADAAARPPVPPTPLEEIERLRTALDDAQEKMRIGVDSARAFIETGRTTDGAMAYRSADAFRREYQALADETIDRLLRVRDDAYVAGDNVTAQNAHALARKMDENVRMLDTLWESAASSFDTTRGFRNFWRSSLFGAEDTVARLSEETGSVAAHIERLSNPNYGLDAFVEEPAQVNFASLLEPPRSVPAQSGTPSVPGAVAEAPATPITDGPVLDGRLVADGTAPAPQLPKWSLDDASFTSLILIPAVSARGAATITGIAKAVGTAAGNLAQSAWARFGNRVSRAPTVPALPAPSTPIMPSAPTPNTPTQPRQTPGSSQQTSQGTSRAPSVPMGQGGLPPLRDPANDNAPLVAANDNQLGLIPANDNAPLGGATPPSGSAATSWANAIGSRIGRFCWNHRMMCGIIAAPFFGGVIATLNEPSDPNPFVGADSRWPAVPPQSGAQPTPGTPTGTPGTQTGTGAGTQTPASGTETTVPGSAGQQPGTQTQPTPGTQIPSVPGPGPVPGTGSVVGNDPTPVGGIGPGVNTGGSSGLGFLPQLLGMLQKFFGGGQSGGTPPGAGQAPPQTPGSTPIAGNPQRPTVSFIASPEEIGPEKTTRLSWTSLGTVGCTLYLPDNTVLVAGGVAGNVTSPTLSENTIFSVRCLATNGSTISASTTVHVNPASSASGAAPTGAVPGGSSVISNPPSGTSAQPTPAQSAYQPIIEPYMPPQGTAPSGTPDDFCDPALGIDRYIWCLEATGARGPI